MNANLHRVSTALPLSAQTLSFVSHSEHILRDILSVVDKDTYFVFQVECFGAPDNLVAFVFYTGKMRTRWIRKGSIVNHQTGDRAR